MTCHVRQYREVRVFYLPFCYMGIWYEKILHIRSRLTLQMSLILYLLTWLNSSPKKTPLLFDSNTFWMLLKLKEYHGMHILYSLRYVEHKYYWSIVLTIWLKYQNNLKTPQRIEKHKVKNTQGFDQQKQLKIPLGIFNCFCWSKPCNVE